MNQTKESRSKYRQTKGNIWENKADISRSGGKKSGFSIEMRWSPGNLKKKIIPISP